MANNLVVQLLLKTGTFSTDLKQAKGQVQNFQKGCQDAGKSLNAFGSAMGINLGAVTKLAGGIGAAAIAGKEFKAILDSTQTTSDAFQGAIAGAKGVLDAFNTSIASADFTSFSNGLWSVYEAAKAVQDALDQLNNTTIAYDYKSKQNMTAFQEAYNVFKDPNSTAQMKEDAKRQMKEAVDAQFAYAANYSSALYKTYVSQVVKKAGGSNLRPNMVTMSQFERAMEIDLSANPEQGRDSINSQYQDYLRKLKEYGKNNGPAQYDLQKRYRDVIAIHAMLELMKDDELKGVAQLLTGIEEARQQALSMQKTMNRALGQGSSSNNKPAPAVKDTKEELEEVGEVIEKIEAGSKKLYDMLISSLTKERDALEIGSDAWKQRNDMIRDLSKLVSLLETNAKIDEIASINPPTINSLQAFLSILQQMRNEAAIGSEDFKEYSELIELVQNKLNEVTGVAQTTAPATDSWDTFNQAMANTATIVNSLTNAFKENSEVTAASVLQMVATCLPAVGSLISAIGALTATEAVEAGVSAVGKAVSTSKHWIEAIAAVASLGAVVAAAISSASKPKVQRFATGGIVGGTSFTGDRVSAQVNSGEMILNKAQQANLFRMANSGMGGGSQVEFHISGTELVGVLNNQNRKNRIVG